LVEAILRGEKTSTSALLSDYERDEDPFPAVGERFLLIDEGDREVGIIETTEMRVATIGAVDLPFALEEGEGFTSVADWRAAHERFWLSYADETRAWLNDPAWRPHDDTPIICERFRLVERFAPTEQSESTTRPVQDDM
jgi:uncharacterized protein YhfF